MKTFTIQDIRSWEPCYDPNKWLPEDWSGTVVDILKNNAISFEDRFWCVLRTDLISDRVMRIFAVWCARQVESLILPEQKKKFNDVLDTIQRYIRGEATEEEREAAWTGTRDAALDAAHSVARHAALDASQSAAEIAARNAARNAAWYATWDAAWDAAHSVARNSPYSVAWYATWDAAWDAARTAQRDKLIEMILATESKL